MSKAGLQQSHPEAIKELFGLGRDTESPAGVYLELIELVELPGSLALSNNYTIACRFQDFSLHLRFPQCPEDLVCPVIQSQLVAHEMLLVVMHFRGWHSPPDLNCRDTILQP
jgi:hypothetical protein